jgi:virulence-associated protein VapD
MDMFFRQFMSNGVNASTFFSQIYPIYSDESLEIYNYNPSNSKVNPLVDLLHKISGFSNSGLVDAFIQLKSFLGPDGLNLSFNRYITFLNALKARVLHNNLQELWNDFRTYYGKDQGIEKNKITPSMFIAWIDRINRESPTQSYFSNNEGNFNNYLKILIKHNYATNSLIGDIQNGQTYMFFLDIHKDYTKQGFVTETDNNSGVLSIFSNIYNYLFGIEEGMENENNQEYVINQSDTTILKNFGIKDFSNELKPIKDKLMRYGLQNIDTSKPIWRNMINVLDRLTKLQISIDDLDDFINLMRTIGANRINEWYDVLDILTMVNIIGYNNVTIFIDVITKFGVTYQTNIRLFVSKLKSFSADFSSGDFGPLTKFVNDMITTKNTYKTSNGSDNVNLIIDYFSYYKFTLNTYHSNIPIQWQNIELPANYPSILVTTLYSYDTSVQMYKNDLYDIKYNRDRLFDGRDIIYAIDQAYMLCTNSYSYKNTRYYKDKVSIILPNVPLIAAFFYKEEMDAIISKPNHYSNINMRVKLMDDIVFAMNRYVIKLKSDPGYEQVVETYTSIANFIKVFPLLSFQYLSNEFMSKCITDKKCTYHITVDSDYTEAKASTTKKSVNMRPNPPVV